MKEFGYFEKCPILPMNDWIFVGYPIQSYQIHYMFPFNVWDIINRWVFFEYSKSFKILLASVFFSDFQKTSVRLMRKKRPHALALFQLTIF